MITFSHSSDHFWSNDYFCFTGFLHGEMTAAVWLWFHSIIPDSLLQCIYLHLADCLRCAVGSEWTHGHGTWVDEKPWWRATVAPLLVRFQLHCCTECDENANGCRCSISLFGGAASHWLLVQLLTDWPLFPSNLRHHHLHSWIQMMFPRRHRHVCLHFVLPPTCFNHLFAVHFPLSYAQICLPIPFVRPLRCATFSWQQSSSFVPVYGEKHARACPQSLLSKLSKMESWPRSLLGHAARILHWDLFGILAMLTQRLKLRRQSRTCRHKTWFWKKCWWHSTALRYLQLWCALYTYLIQIFIDVRRSSIDNLDIWLLWCWFGERMLDCVPCLACEWCSLITPLSDSGHKNHSFKQQNEDRYTSLHKYNLGVIQSSI